MGLEDEVEEDEHTPSKFDDSPTYALSLADVVAADPYEAMVGASANSRLIESSDDEEDLVDQQLEADCPWLCADHRQTIEDDNLEAMMTFSCNTWDTGPRRESLHPTRASSLDTFAKELFEAAEKCNPDPQIA